MHSQPLPGTLTHSHPFFKKNNQLPLIFRQQRPTPTHFSINTIDSHHFSRKVTHSHPSFKKSNPLPPIFRQKRRIPSLISTITTHSHPFFKKKTHPHTFFDKNDTLLPIFQQKRLTPTHFRTKTTNSPIFQSNHRLPSKAFTELLSQPPSPTPSDFYPLSGIFILLHCNYLRKRLALTRFPTNTANFWSLLS